MSKKLTYEEVKNNIESFEGYELLTDEYNGAHTKLEIKCPEEHNFSISYTNFKQGRRCPICYNKKRRRLTYQEVKSNIESVDGYKLLSTEYINNNTKLQMQCPEGHIFWKCYNAFQSGSRCPECAKKKCGEYHKLTYEEVKNYVEKRKHKLLSTEYINAHTKLEMRCPEGHVFWTSYNVFQQGCRCSECHFETKRTPNQEIIDKLQLYEFIRETEHKQMEVKCTYCGEWYIPDRKNLFHRIRYINGDYEYEGRLYCSQQCKDECPIYGQYLYPKGHKPATSREVQPQLRQLVLARDNYTCQKCDKHKDELDVGLHCHHIFPLNESPITSADVDTCITFCKSCHIEIHKEVAGCGYAEMICSE